MKDDYLFDGLYADDYKDENTRRKILESYQERYQETPVSSPNKFDPLNPPGGWRYDPYYECWVRL